MQATENTSTRSFSLILPVVSLAILIMVAFSCKKHDPEDTPGKVWLMTINFTDDYIHPDLKAIVFISDLAGRPVTDTMISGNSRLVLFSRTTATPPFHVTVVTWEPDMHNFLVTIHTTMYVHPSEWHLRGDRPAAVGNATINCENIPAHSGPVLFSNTGHSNLTFSMAGNNHPLYLSPDNLYIKLSTPGSDLFHWSDSLTGGQVFTVDLSVMDTAVTKLLPLPFAAQDYHMKLYGYRETPDFRPSMSMAADERIGDGKKHDTISFAYPPGKMDNFLFTLSMISEWGSTATHEYSHFGSLPESVKITDAQLLQFQEKGPEVKLSTTGTFTTCTAEWDFQDANRLAFRWTIEGPDTVTSIRMPELPGTMTEMFPTLSTDSLILRLLTLTRFFRLAGYDQVLEEKAKRGDLEFYTKEERAAINLRIN